MICSHNEVGAVLRKAAIGSGFPVGVADDLAAAGLWLCARHLDGVGAVLDAVAQGFAPEPGCEAPSAIMHVTDAGVGRSGASSFELLVAGDVDLVIVDRCDAPLMLLGLAGRVATAIHTAFELSVEGRPPIVVSGSMTTFDDLALEPGDSIRIEMADAADTSPTAEPAPIARVEVDDQEWAAVTALAARTYVAATEESRRRGAGAPPGNDDVND